MKSAVSSTVEKIAISLPRETLGRIERLRKKNGLSRSALIRQAIERFFREQDEAARILRYQEAYRKYPETPEEISAAESAATESLSKEPWT